MADVKVSALPTVTVVALTDYIIVNKDITGTMTTCKITNANYLVSLGIRKGETNIINVTTAGITVTFANAHGASANDHHLVINCRNATDDSEIGYEITAHDELGFTITPLEDARIEWTVIDK
jgi:hypothetical protein